MRGLRGAAFIAAIWASSAAAAADVSGFAAARALPASGPWIAYYGDPSGIDVAKLGAAFKLVFIDADPGGGPPPFGAADIAALKASGAKVLSYLNFGACERSRSYWTDLPFGFVSCGANTAAQLGSYAGYPEVWMNVGNRDFQNLIANYVAPRLVAAGVDGFMLDNFEVIEHDKPAAREGYCDAACRRGGLELVATLRRKYPDLSIVLNNASIRSLGDSAGGIALPLLVDGVLAEDVYLPSLNRDAVRQLDAWSGAGRKPGRANFFVGTLDYVPTCSATTLAAADWDYSKQAGFSPSVSTVDLASVCWWPFLANKPASALRNRVPNRMKIASRGDVIP